MLRLFRTYQFSQFYHPCSFQFDPNTLKTATCPLKSYVSLFRTYGHFYAKLDPLGLYNKTYDSFAKASDLQLSNQDKLNSYRFFSPLTRASQTLEDLEEKLKETYLGSTGVEFEHINSLSEKEWLYSRFESLKMEAIKDQIKVKLARGLIEAQALDHFLHKKWVTFKRYSGEGAESTVVALEQLFQASASAGYEHVVFGMPHRGRLSTLVNVLNYAPKYLFRKISGKTDTPDQLPQIIDDVTSHVAQSTTRQFSGNKLKISLVHNPSHLQAQNPVAMGKTLSKQQLHGRAKVLNLQVHGDAAVCAQGIVFQTLCLSKTPNYSVGGTVHIITNNQIGYTTRPIDSRPSKYATDLFKAYEIPILHVNSENIEDVQRAITLSVEYKTKFNKDIMIDLICYRKFGHNEVDQPEFTQPKMYHQIRKAHQPSPIKYSKALAEKSLVSSDFYETVRKEKFAEWEKQYNEAQTISKVTGKEYFNPSNINGARAFTEAWKQMVPSQYGQELPTSFDIGKLKQFAIASTFTPPGFAVHNRIKKMHLQKRLKAIEKDELDWATCEALAFFSLIYEGHNVRMSGQDVERGTFSQRHLVMTDQNTEETFNPLNHFASEHPGRGKPQILNSALSQNAVMSFQYGYSIDNPNNLAIWQAQFGDFFNTAQVVIDVFLTNSQNKWLRQSSLALILPHGFDGAGPEHSSCRMERFLQMANSDGSLRQKVLKDHNPQRQKQSLQDPCFFENIQEANFSLVNPTKPANLFHLLRRQMKRNFRKPLVIAGPKTLLRHPSCLSKFSEMGEGTSFQPVLGYRNASRIEECESVIFCSGKFVYDIEALAVEKKAEKTCILAIEELYPFPERIITDILSKANKNSKFYWVQEENVNGGAFQFTQNRINRALKSNNIPEELSYIGRRAISATAVGSGQLHKKQTLQLQEWIKTILS